MSDSPTLILIDMQRAMQSSALPARNNPDAEKSILKLLQAWRNSGRSVVHVRHISREPESLFRPGQEGVEFQEAFAPLPAEHVVEKNVPDAFVNTGLERWLHAHGVESVVLVGVSTNNSVEATARSAGNLGFKTLVVADATFAFSKRDYAGVLRSAEEVHAMALANLQGEYASIVTTSELLKSTQFLSVSPILSVASVDTAISYYESVLGFHLGWKYGDPTSVASVCKDKLELMLELSPAASAVVPSKIYVTTSGLDAYYAQIVAAGATITYPLAARDYGMKDCRVQDPDGNEISFGERLG